MMQINGDITDSISALDRGLLYGDGLFETLTVADGEPQHWPRHLARLTVSCQRLKIEAPDGDELLVGIRTLCAGKTRAVAKIIVTRGRGGRGYNPINTTASTILQCLPWPKLPIENSEKGVIARICDLRLASQPLLAGMKHLNRLENVLARAEWSDSSIAEGILRDNQGHFIEGTMSNFFVVKNSQIFTDPLQQCGVAGIMRELIIEAAEELGFACTIQPINEQQIKDADELFISNSLIGIWPIKQLIGWGDYTVGVITQQLQCVIKDR